MRRRGERGSVDRFMCSNDSSTRRRGSISSAALFDPTCQRHSLLSASSSAYTQVQHSTCVTESEPQQGEDATTGTRYPSHSSGSFARTASNSSADTTTIEWWRRTHEGSCAQPPGNQCRTLHCLS
eukprot:313221-Rhodomonas_salina.2